MSLKEDIESVKEDIKLYKELSGEDVSQETIATIGAYLRGYRQAKEDVEQKGDGMNIVNVRWWDGYLEIFEATEVRFGCDLLWLRLSNGENRHIPLRQVRWFSLSKESHAEIVEGVTE